MKFRNLKYLLLAVVGLTIASCETMPDAEVEYSPVWPVSGDWYVKVQLPNGSYATQTNSAGKKSETFALRTYNTAANTKDSIWVRVGSASYPFGLIGKSACSVEQKTFSIQNGYNTVYKANFTITEGKVLLGQAKAPGTHYAADSIYIKYTLANTGATYIAAGYRKTAFAEDEPVFK